jgi:hypothetical protein
MRNQCPACSPIAASLLPSKRPKTKFERSPHLALRLPSTYSDRDDLWVCSSLKTQRVREATRQARDWRRTGCNEVESARTQRDGRQSDCRALENSGVRGHCLGLGGKDLTSPADKMTMQVINTVAEFERDLLIKRTNTGIKRAKAEGQSVWMPTCLDHGPAKGSQAQHSGWCSNCSDR